MFGFYRTLLAGLVVFHHLNWIPLIGPFAVHGFFVLSGYLMTLILKENYGYDGRGFVGFVGNRLLRLYPSYLAVLLLSVAIIALIGSEAARQFRSPIFLPDSVGEWLQNVSMIYASTFPNAVRPRLSPATWALTLELFNYLLLAMGISRSVAMTWLWFLLSAAYHGVAVVSGWGHDYVYLHVLSASLPFSLGALLYHYRDRVRLPAMPDWVVASLATLGVCALSFVGARAGGESMTFAYLVCFYGNMLLALIAVAALSIATGDRRLDRFVGNFSYHIYVSHWIIGLAVFQALYGLDTPTRSGTGYLASFTTLGICLALSIALTRWIDDPVERIRRRLRPGVRAAAVSGQPDSGIPSFLPSGLRY